MNVIYEDQFFENDDNVTKKSSGTEEMECQEDTESVDPLAFLIEELEQDQQSVDQAKCASFEAIAISGDNETEVEDDESCCSDYESEDEQADISQPFSKAPTAAAKPSNDAMWTLGKRSHRQTALNFGGEDDELMINQEKQNGGKRQRKADSKFNVQTRQNEKGLFQSRIATREPLI